MIYKGKVSTTEMGTPQGGVISPLLGNIALNGLEETIINHPEIKKEKRSKVKIVRYADDIVITGATPEILEKCKAILEKFIAERGLELNQTKTRIVNIREGIDLLGFTIRKMKRDYRYNEKSEQATVLIIKPSRKGIKAIKTKIKQTVKLNRNIRKIVNELNPILRG